MLDDKNIPGKTLGCVGELKRNFIVECAKVIGKLLRCVFVGEDYGEVDVAGTGQVVALGLHAPEYVAVGVVGWGIVVIVDFSLRR